MENKTIDQLFEFLKANSGHNRAFQKRYYESLFGGVSSHSERVIQLLYSVVNTQRQPKIDPIGQFFKKLHDNKAELVSFSQFLDLHGQNDTEKPFYSLYQGLKSNPGWGPKTSALFVKNVINIHLIEDYKAFRFWDDIPLDFLPSDQIYLPVDIVIINLFIEFIDTSCKDFESVNKFLNKKYKKVAEILLWDDLWFWGYFTQIPFQKSNAYYAKREFLWNENKYWASAESNKDELYMQELKNLAREFMLILKGE
jgi:hypothetical protein